MRTTIGRVALRSASRILVPSTPRGTALATRYPIRPRELCSTAVSSDGVRKVEESDVAPAATVTAVTGIAHNQPPEISIIGDDNINASADAMAKEGVLASSIEETGSSAEADVQSNDPSAVSQVKNDPKELRKLLGEILQKKAVRSALWYYTNALKTPGQPAIDENVMKIMLPMLGRYGWAPSSMDTLKLAVEREYNLGAGYYNCGLHAISRSGDTKGFAEVLDGMWKLTRESHPNATSYTYLIGAYVYRGAIDDAFGVLTEMKKHMIYPTFATYHALITGCLRRRDSQRAYSTLLAVEKQRFDISAMTVAQVLVSSAQNDDCENVLNLVAKLEESLPRYAAEMHRIAENRATYKLSETERTSKDERAELRGSPKPEMGAISEILHCGFRNGRADVGMAGWDMLKRHYPGMEVPPSLWYCMIGAFAGAGDFSRAFDVLGAMREAGHKPSLKDLEVALIRPLSFDIGKIDEQFFRLSDKVGRKGEELESFKETATLVQDDEEVPSESSILDNEPRSENSESESGSQDPAGSSVDSQLNNASSATGDSEQESLADILSKPDHLEVNSIKEEFSPKTVGIDELNCIIASCSFAGDLDRAFQTYDEVESRFHLERNADTFNALLEGCVQVRHVRGGLRILREMESVGFRVTDSTVQLGARLLLRGGRMEEAMDLVRNVQADGGRVPLQTYQMLIRNCVRGGSLDDAATVIEIAGEAGIEGRTLTGRLGPDTMNNLKGIIDLKKGRKDGGKTRAENGSLEKGGDAAMDAGLNSEEALGVPPGSTETDSDDIPVSIEHTEVSKH